MEAALTTPSHQLVHAADTTLASLFRLAGPRLPLPARIPLLVIERRLVDQVLELLNVARGTKEEDCKVG